MRRAEVTYDKVQAGIAEAPTSAQGWLRKELEGDARKFAWFYPLVEARHANPFYRRANV